MSYCPDPTTLNRREVSIVVGQTNKSHRPLWSQNKTTSRATFDFLLLSVTSDTSRCKSWHNTTYYARQPMYGTGPATSASSGCPGLASLWLLRVALTSADVVPEKEQGQGPRRAIGSRGSGRTDG